jgi:hypothetical protein
VCCVVARTVASGRRRPRVIMLAEDVLLEDEQVEGGAAGDVEGGAADGVEGGDAADDDGEDAAAMEAAIKAKFAEFEKAINSAHSNLETANDEIDVLTQEKRRWLAEKGTLKRELDGTKRELDGTNVSLSAALVCALYFVCVARPSSAWCVVS